MLDTVVEALMNCVIDRSFGVLTSCDNGEHAKAGSGRGEGRA